ncbi:MAG TPA: rod shape-determining protein [bacterium]|nr:rod shape-determining protein [bacterium]
MRADVGVDLGTANSLVYVRGEGIVVREPSVIARTEDGDILAVGEEAKRMIGRTPAHITATRPMKGGVIADFGVTSAMLAYFFRKALRTRYARRPRVVVGIPTGASQVERRAVIDASLQAGAGEAYLIDEPLAAALGVGSPISDPVATTIVDIGGGRTDVAVIALGGIVTSGSIRVAGDEMDEAIIQYARRVYNLVIGERTAEAIKIEVGSATPFSGESTVEVRGRQILSGLPRIVKMTAAEVREAIAEPVRAIMETVRRTLEHSPPELSADMVTRGIVLVGGGALLRGIDKLVGEETGMPVRLSSDPLSAVIMGAGSVLYDMGASLRVLRSAASLTGA